MEIMLPILVGMSVAALAGAGFCMGVWLKHNLRK